MATGKSAGRVSVRVYPDSTKFRDDLEPKLKAIEKSLRVKIAAALDESGIQDDLGRLRERVQRTKLPSLKINADLKRFDDTIKRTEARLAGNPLYLRIEAEADKAAAELQKFRTAQGVGPLTVEVQAQVDKAEEALRKLREEAGHQKAIFEAEAQTKGASAQLAVASRPRLVPFVVKVNPGSLAVASAAIARLSGARVVGDYVQRLGTYLSNLDKNVPRLAAVGLAITNIAAAALAGSSGVLSLASGLTQVTGAAVVLPALLAGGAVSMVTLALALKDTKDRLKELKDPLSEFQKSISGDFWRGAERPLTVMAQTLLPRLESSMGRVSRSLGNFVGSLSYALSANLTKSSLGTMMDNLAEGIDNASFGLRPLVNALTKLGLVGSAYLPRMGAAFDELSRRFSAFISKASDDGSLKRWADGGIQALKTLGTIVGSVSGILGGLFKAADAAGGGNGLTAFAANLQGIAKIINGPAFQGALTTLFRGALDAMSGLGKAIGPIGDMIVALAPALSEVMATAGSAVGGLLASLASALSSPVFAEGLSDFFAGIAAGLSAIGPAMPAVVAALSVLGSVAGTLAANLGTVLGAALTALAPVVVALATALQPLIPILGATLVTAIQTLAPALQMLVVALGQGLAAVIPALVPIIAQLAVTFTQILTALIPVIPPILQLVAAFLSGLLPAIVALTPVLVQLATTIAAVLVTAVNTLVPLIPQLAAAWLQVVASLLPLIPLVSQFLAAIIPIIPPIIQAMAAGSMFAAMLVGKLAAAFVAVVGRILAFSASVQAMAGRVAAGFTNVAARAVGLASRLLATFNNMRNVVSAAMSAIAARISSAWSAVVSRFSSAVATVKSTVQSGFSAAVALVTSAMSRFGSAVTTGVSRVLSVVRGIPGRIRGALGNLGSMLHSAGADIVRGLVNGIQSQIGAAASAAARMARAAINAAKAALKINSPSKVFKEIGRYVGDGLVLGLTGSTSKIQTASKKLRTLLAKALDAKGITRGTYNSLVKQSKSAEKSLVGLANSRAAVAKKLSDATTKLNAAVKLRDDYKATIRASVNDLGNVTNFVDSSGGTDASWIISGLEQAVAKAKKFGELIAQLKQKGLSNTALKQIADKGVEGGLNVAQALADGGTAAISQVNALQRKLDQAGLALGTVTSNAFYQSGVQAAAGLVKGLQSQSAQLAAAASKIALALAAAVKKALKIKSPSQVFRDQVGKQIAAGMAVGMLQGKGQVDAAAASLTDLRRFKVRTAASFLPDGMTAAAAATRNYLEGATLYGYTPQDVVDALRTQESIDNALFGAWG